MIGGAVMFLKRKIKNSGMPVKLLTGSLMEAFRDAYLELSRKG